MSSLHPRGCLCDACSPGAPAQPTIVTTTVRRRWSNQAERKKSDNAKAYLKRKLRDVEGRRA